LTITSDGDSRSKFSGDFSEISKITEVVTALQLIRGNAALPVDDEVAGAASGSGASLKVPRLGSPTVQFSDEKGLSPVSWIDWPAAGAGAAEDPPFQRFTVLARLERPMFEVVFHWRPLMILAEFPKPPGRYSQRSEEA